MSYPLPLLPQQLPGNGLPLNLRCAFDDGQGADISVQALYAVPLFQASSSVIFSDSLTMMIMSCPESLSQAAR